MVIKDQTAPKTVLICDDDEDILDVATIVLTEKGYRIEQCSDGEAVCEAAARIQPDLVLLDLWMPGLGGEDIINRLRADMNTRHIPVVFVSANKDTAKIAQSADANGYLCKPFDIEELEAIVEVQTGRIFPAL